MEPDLSTTALAVLRGAGQEDNPFKASTLRERAYIRGLNPPRLASQTNVELSDDEDALDETLDAAVLAGEFNQLLLKEDNDEDQERQPSDTLLTAETTAPITAYTVD
ncbi:hypothetical protein N431DRAFT_447147 [Stipitochalara longipes BDJ]|nr:hypothetical protein N431DRAFT_447147 [Stipitochalara longipes BDJ]